MRSVQKILATLFFVAIGASAISAIGGSVVALVGGALGLESLRSIGGIIAGMGAIAFFALLVSPLGEAVSYMPIGSRKDPH